MIATRWRKVWRDVMAEKGRMLLMIVALAVSLAGVGAVLGAYTILKREMALNYLGTHPASAVLDVASPLNSSIVEEVRRLPGVADAQAGDVVHARAKVGSDWIPMLLFVVDDFEAMRLNTFRPVRGDWPPPDGAMLVERSAQSVLAVRDGDSVVVKTAHGRAVPVPVRGVVHDPGLSPAGQERHGYGYITRATLAVLGEAPVLTELRLKVADTNVSAKSIEERSFDVVRWLAARGYVTTQARIPPPGEHPHQGAMLGVIYMLLVFGALALLLSAVVVATTVSAMLSRQLREIAVMKTIGGRTSQVAAMYAVLVASLGAVAVMVALPSGALAARFLAGTTATMLNLELGSAFIPWWVFAAQAAGGIAVPLLVAALPIARGSRATVHAAIDQHGASQPELRSRWLPLLAGLGGLGRWSRIVSLALRNALRRRARTALTVVLLISGGAMFGTALDLARAWERLAGRVVQEKTYDVEMRLNEPKAVEQRLRRVDGVREVEAWGYGPAAVWSPDHVDVARTYPDGSHGSLSMMGSPASTALVHLPVWSGRWLIDTDTDAVVLNHLAAALVPNITVGDRVVLSLGGKPTEWRLVGIVEEVGAGGVAYVTRDAFARAAGSGEGSRMLRIATSSPSAEARAGIVRELERVAEGEGASVEATFSLADRGEAIDEHAVLLIRLLVAMAMLMLTVGAIGLAATLGMNVVERTRETGVMKAMGATPTQLASLVVAEALVMALMSWLASFIVSVPLTALVGEYVGKLSFGAPLPMVVDVGGMTAWLGVVVVVSLGATLFPARRASRITIVEALGQV